MKNITKILLAYSTAALPIVSLAGTSPSFQSNREISVNKDITIDGYDSEWVNRDPLVRIKSNDMGVELLSDQFIHKYYRSLEPSVIKTRTLDSFFLKIDKNHPTFRVGERIRIRFRLQTANARTGEFIKERVCRREHSWVNSNPPEKCSWEVIKKEIVLIRDDKGTLVHWPSPYYYRPNSSIVDKKYREDDNFEYFEYYDHHGWISLMKKHNARIAVDFAAVNALEDIQQARSNFQGSQLRSFCGICNTPPGGNTYIDQALVDMPSILSTIPKPIIQVGGSAQTPGGDINVVVSTDFKEAIITVEPGGGYNTDYEAEVMVNALFAPTLAAAVSGHSSTLSGDIGLGLGVGGNLIYDSNNNLMGAGITAGFAGVPDTDLTVNVPKELYNSSDSDKESGSDKRPHGYDSNKGQTNRNPGEGGHSIEF